MNKLVSIILICLFSLSGMAQSIYYYELSNGKGDGHFITITSKSCYDSDKNGYSLRNGVRFFKGEQNNQFVFYGMSVFGDAYYYFSSDYSKLKVVTAKGDASYYYTRKTAPQNVVSAHGQVPMPNSSGQVEPTYPTYNATSTPSYNTNQSSSTQVVTHRQCAGCNGSGMCTMCKGKGWYKNIYSGTVESCSSCGGSGRCKVCHGKGHVD